MLSTSCCNVVLHTVNNVVLHLVNNCCQQLLFTVVHVQQTLFNHCWKRSASFFHQLLSALVSTNCNNYCSLSTSNNYWSNNTQQHCQFNKCCWTLTTTLFRRCSTNNVASTWSTFARVAIYINSKPFTILNRPLIDLFLFPTDQYLALISWLIALYV